jgi:hypothetical protein
MTNRELQIQLTSFVDGAAVKVRCVNPNTKEERIYDIVEVQADLDGALVQTAFTEPWLGGCLCTDPLCPHCHGRCTDQANCVVYRSDMQDETGTQMCYFCSEDALNSGCFNTKEEIV